MCFQISQVTMTLEALREKLLPIEMYMKVISSLSWERPLLCVYDGKIIFGPSHRTSKTETFPWLHLFS